MYSPVLGFMISVTIMRKSFESFRQYCVKTDVLPVDFYIVLSDVLAGAGKYYDYIFILTLHACSDFCHLCKQFGPRSGPTERLS